MCMAAGCLKCCPNVINCGFVVEYKVRQRMVDTIKNTVCFRQTRSIAELIRCRSRYIQVSTLSKSVFFTATTINLHPLIVTDGLWSMYIFLKKNYHHHPSIPHRNRVRGRDSRQAILVPVICLLNCKFPSKFQIIHSLSCYWIESLNSYSFYCLCITKLYDIQ